MDDLRAFGELVRRGARFYARHGFGSSLEKVGTVLTDRRGPSRRSYDKWRRSRGVDSRESTGPRVSVLVPVSDPEPRHLEALVSSLRAQTSSRWELVLVDDGSRRPAVQRCLTSLTAADRRMRVVRRPTRGGISCALNEAAAHARGEVFIFADHDDELAPDVVARVAAAFTREPEVDLVYTDEDRLTTWGAHAEPVFKPGPSSWLALSFNYVTHLVAVRREVFETLGGMRSAFDGSQDHDFLLRVLERGRVRHLAGVGYHWRRTPGSVSFSTTAKPWAFEAGLAAVREACRRRQLPVDDVLPGDLPGVYRLVLRPLGAPLRAHVVLHGPAPRCAEWSTRLLARPDLVDVQGLHQNVWPAGPVTGGVLVVDATVSSDLEALERLLRWSAMPGVGAVAAAGGTPRTRRHAGYSVTRGGWAEPVLPELGRRRAGPSLLGAGMREVAASAEGVLWAATPPAWFTRAQAGRPVAAASVLCLSMAHAVAGHATLFLPEPVFPEAAGTSWSARPVSLAAAPAWETLARALPPAFWTGASDRFCPRHDLLTPLGMPPPAVVAARPAGAVPTAGAVTNGHG